MIKWVIKRDRRKERLKADKIKYAVWKSYEDLALEVNESDLDIFANEVATELNNTFEGNIRVVEIQNAVERKLMLVNPDVAKNYILYRNERDRQRTIESDLINSVRKIKTAEIKSNNTVRDNANENGQTPAGQYGKVGSEMQKTYNLLNNIDRRFAEEHANGDMHIHDLNFYDLSFNCLFAPVGKTLKTGFDSGTGFLRSPKSINTAGYLTAVILQLQSNQQFGGIASDNIDYDLAPYVDLSFRRNLLIELIRYYAYSGSGLSFFKRVLNAISYIVTGKFRYSVFTELNENNKLNHLNPNDSIANYKMLIDREIQFSKRLEPYKRILEDKFKKFKFNELTLNFGKDYLLTIYPKEPLEAAIEQTDRDTYQAMEGLVANLNSLQSRSGNQVPFSSLNFGLDTSICGRMLSKNLIKAQMAGLGDGLTAIFPILIFKLMKGITFNPQDPNYDLYLESIKCLARRFYPNFVGVDNKFNEKYIKYDTKKFHISGEIELHRIGTDESIRINMFTLDEFFTSEGNDLLDYEIVEANGTTWQITGAGIDKGEIVIDTRRLKPETTVATMGCRTRVIGNKNGVEQTTGRGNIAFHTINLPRLAIKAHIESQDPAERKRLFFKYLNNILEDAKQSLIDRFNLISKKTFENFPFTMQQGLYLTSDDKPHKVTDTIGEILKQGTLSIGYIGIYETLLVLTGKVWGKDEELKAYGIEIVKHIHDFCKKLEKETEFNWSCFATPAESVAGRFCNIDRNLYQDHPLLSDVDSFQLFGKGYYTNSHMLPFDLDTNLVNKVAWEAPLHELTTAGHIFYHKIDGDLSQNLEGVKSCIDYMYNHDLGYFTVTMDSDTCINKLPDGTTCGFHGVIGQECPKCGCKNEDYFIRVRRITGYLTGSPRKSIMKSWNDGKLAELNNRKNI